jgi:hypothetical protein
MLWPNFCGAAYRSQSYGITADSALNIYLETVRNAADPKKATLYGTPGQRQVSDFIAGGPCRGLFSQDGRIFGVFNTSFVEYNPVTQAFTSVATVATDGRLATFASNGQGGNQLAICSAGNLYIFNLVTSVFTGPVALPFVPVMVDFMDGYFLANEKNTIKMWFSNLENGLVWSATDFFTRSSTSDNITGFTVNNRRIWVIGSQTTEIFQDSGDATTPFIPYPGTVINEGTNAYASIISMADTVFWSGSTNHFGNAQIFAASSLQPRAISTPAISYQIAFTLDASEAEALAYTQAGHNFIAWTWPSIDATWVYDLTEEVWHQRGRVIESPAGSGNFLALRWQARGCCSYLAFAGGAPQVLVGQWGSGALCVLDLLVNTDAGYSVPTSTVPIFRQRIAPYISAENQWLFLQQLELGIDPVLGGMPAGRVQLRLSGRVSSNPTIAEFGPAIDAAATLQDDGQAVAQWFQLGRYRSDRLLILIRQMVDAPCVWGPGLNVRATPGTGQL